MLHQMIKEEKQNLEVLKMERIETELPTEVRANETSWGTDSEFKTKRNTTTIFNELEEKAKMKAR
jgi:hypothetical protein